MRRLSFTPLSSCIERSYNKKEAMKTLKGIAELLVVIVYMHRFFAPFILLGIVAIVLGEFGELMFKGAAVVFTVLFYLNALGGKKLNKYSVYQP